MTEEQILLQNAGDEIFKLRNENALLQAKVEAYENCLLLLKSAPNFSFQTVSVGKDNLAKIKEFLDRPLPEQVTV